MQEIPMCPYLGAYYSRRNSMYIMIGLVFCGRIIDFPVMGEPTMGLYHQIEQCTELEILC
jgi:hypothetical protein